MQDICSTNDVTHFDRTPHGVILFLHLEMIGTDVCCELNRNINLNRLILKKVCNVLPMFDLFEEITDATSFQMVSKEIEKMSKCFIEIAF